MNLRVVLLILLVIGIVVAGTLLIRSGGDGDDGERVISPVELPNYSRIKIGSSTPLLQMSAADGKSTILPEAIRGSGAVVAVVMPGCESCDSLIRFWTDKRISKGDDWRAILVLIGSPADAEGKVPEELMKSLSVYYCTESDLFRAAGGTGYPTQIGIGADGTVQFVCSGFSERLNRRFFDKYL